MFSVIKLRRSILNWIVDLVITCLGDALKLCKCDTTGVVLIEQLAKIDYFLPARHPYLFYWDLVLLKYLLKFILVDFVKRVESLDKI